jgi:RecJ-like exonuclease
MNDKIKKLSTKLVDLFPQKEFLDPQEAFTSFSDVYIPQKDYFGNFSPEDIIKLVIYIYSYKNTKDFDYGDKILNNLAFSDLLLITDENYTATCNECNGYGGWECETCGGGGEMRCLECDGDGKTDDNKTCEECSGRGDFTIACWDKNMNDACEQSEGDLYGAFTYDYFLARFEKYIILNIVNDHRRLNVNLEMDKMYATDYDDNPELTISGQKVLKIFNINNSLISRYTT